MSNPESENIYPNSNESLNTGSTPTPSESSKQIGTTKAVTHKTGLATKVGLGISAVTLVGSLALGGLRRADSAPVLTPIPTPGHTLDIQPIPPPIIIEQKPSTSSTSNPSRESLKTQEIKEQETVTEYSMNNISISGERLIGIISHYSDETKTNYIVNIAIGNINNQGQLTLTEKAISTQIYLLGTAISNNDSNIMVAFGDTQRMAGQGKVLYTKDGGNSWYEFKDQAIGTVIDAQITPDNKYAFVTAGDKTNEYTPTFYRLDLNTGRFIKLTDPNYRGSGGSTALQTIAPDTYTNYSTPYYYWTSGHLKNTFFPDGSVNTQVINANIEGDVVMPIVQFTGNQGRSRVWTFNNWSGEDSEGRNTGLVFDNINDQINLNKDPSTGLTIGYIRPHSALYPEAQSSLEIEIGVDNLTYDLEKNEGYMATFVRGAVGDLDDYHPLPRIEAFDLTNPQDLSKRHLLPINGDWPASGFPKEIKVIKTGGEKYMLASIGSPYESSVNSLYILDVTDGVDSTWKKIGVELPSSPPQPPVNVHKAYLPLTLR